jgi:glucan phosphoethanolaminetransferase (alkaline phosphatase superfamily)
LISTYSSQLVDLVRAINATTEIVVLATSAGFVVAASLLWASLRIEWLGQLHQRLSTGMVWTLIVFSICMPALVFYEFSAVPPVQMREPLSLTFYPEAGVKPVQSNSFEGTQEIERAEEVAREKTEVSKDAILGNVIIIVGDALRRDHMGIFGYHRDTTPFLNHLDKLGQVAKAERMASVCAESSCGLFAIANSKFVHEFSDRAFGLPELLKRYGYRIDMILGGDHTNFYGLRELYGAVDSYFDGASANGRYMNDDQLVIERVKALPAFAGKPVYLQIHLMSAHPLGTRQQRFLKFLPSENYATVLFPTGGPVLERTNFYDNGVLQLDHIVQQISVLLAEKGYLNRALVVLTGDHGEMLGEHQEYSHAKSVYQPALDVPFVMITYGDLAVERFVHRKMTSQVDIAPTIARALNIPRPSTWSGEALQEPSRRESIFFQQGAQVGVIGVSESGKTMKYWRNLATGAEFLFDLMRDEREQFNLVESIESSKLGEWRLQILAPASTVQIDQSYDRVIFIDDCNSEQSSHCTQ